ncbi:unnamed protein product [Durusdinium trenchii]|uniref:LicD/FKTN/FKRP nucleotidyltransferase domain-containing protein n=1 Tax=Durusdinium trenchii TaxID=1381693 RepID=A0ABP0S1S1_9DINO
MSFPRTPGYGFSWGGSRRLVMAGGSCAPQTIAKERLHVPSVWRFRRRHRGFYGLVTAMFLRAQVFAERGSFEDALGSLEDALALLGARWHLDFIREASSWPFGALDLRANRDQLRRWLNSSQWVAGDLATAAPLFRSSPFTGLQEPAAALVVPTEAGWRRGAGHMNRWQASRLLGLVVFGVHSTLVLEPATMLKAALRFWQVQVRIFMRDCPRGNDAWAHHCTLQCHALGECAPSSQGSAQLFVDLVHMFEEAIHERSSYYKVGDYLEVISQMHQIDPELRRSELYVCTAPLMCSLLRAVVEKPLLAYLGMQLHVHVDRQIDQLWLMHFQAMVRDVQSNVWAVHNFAMREQIRYATNVELEVVRPRALYALGTGYSKYGRPQRSPKRSREVLFFRSSYFRLSLFVKVLEAQLQACDFPLPLRLVKASEDFVTFGEMRRFRAAVLFPWDPTLMAFYELYRLNTVLLLPRSGWIFKVQFFTGWIWSQPLGALEFAHLAAARGVESPPYPWWRPEASDPETVLYWYAFSDCQRLPHLLRFGSFSELFLQLLDTDRLRRARRKMQRHNRRALAVGLRWYRDAVLWLLEEKAAEKSQASLTLAFSRLAASRGLSEPTVQGQNVTFMVSEGTLLGAVRDQDIIPYTADLDIFVPREGWERAMLINEERFRRWNAVGQTVHSGNWKLQDVVMIRNISFPEIYVEARYGPNWRVPDHQARELAEKYPTLEEAKARCVGGMCCGGDLQKGEDLGGSKNWRLAWG